MSRINDGGAAFPLHPQVHPELSLGYYGMSLRDYAAIHADLGRLEFDSMDSMLDFIGAVKTRHELTIDEIIQISAKAAAKARYIFADAMIAEREKGRAS